MPRTPENPLPPLTGRLEDEMVDLSGSTGNWVRITETSRRIKSCSRPRHLPGVDSGSLHRRESPFSYSSNQQGQDRPAGPRAESKTK